jgi:hypothetical protein
VVLVRRLLPLLLLPHHHHRRRRRLLLLILFLSFFLSCFVGVWFLSRSMQMVVVPASFFGM